MTRAPLGRQVADNQRHYEVHPIDEVRSTAKAVRERPPKPEASVQCWARALVRRLSERMARQHRSKERVGSAARWHARAVGYQARHKVRLRASEEIVTDPPGFLAHRQGDDVAIAVRDVAAGAATVAYLDTGARETNDAIETIPLGHKVALRDLEDGAKVIEYGAMIGVMYKPVRAGGLVHVHNLRSARWTHGS